MKGNPLEIKQWIAYLRDISSRGGALLRANSAPVLPLVIIIIIPVTQIVAIDLMR